MLHKTHHCHDSTPLLMLQHVQKRLSEHFQLQIENLSIGANQFCVLLGPNAAGKTTLFQLLTGILAPDHGEISLCAYKLPKQRNAALARLGVVFQESTLDADLTAEQNLMFHGSLYGLPSRECRIAIEEEAKRLNIYDVLGRKVRTLNGGHKRRVELVRALLHKPKLLLLDEPTTGLDLESREVILEHVKNLCATDGMAALWCTHLLDEAQDVEQVYLLHEGKLRFQGTAQQLLAAGKTTDIKIAYKNVLQ